jgi:hypothetical protein
MRWFLGALILYASIGLALSLVVHLASFFFQPPGGAALFFALHVAIFPLWIPVVFIVNGTAGKSLFSMRWSWADWWTVLQGAPAWMRVMTYGFFAYALANFAVFIIFAGMQGTSKYSGAPPAFVWRGFSGHWMALYSAGLAIATAAYLRGPDNLGRKCPNGHAVSPADRYCAKCGRAISPQ